MDLRAKILGDQTPAAISSDRRLRSRYPIDLPLQFKLLKDGQCFHSGDGRTVDLSSSGIAFASREIIQPGTDIDLAVSWPVLLLGSCAIKLVVFGRVVRSDPRLTAVEMVRHEFRTLGSRLFSASGR